MGFFGEVFLVVVGLIFLFGVGVFFVILALGYSDCSYHLQKEDRFLPLFLRVGLPVSFPDFLKNVCSSFQ